VIEQDEVFLDPGQSEPIQRAVHYPQNGTLSPSPDQPYPTGTTICVDSSGVQVACSTLSTSVRIMSTEDGMGTPKRQYGVLTQIYSPHAVTLKWDCPGSGNAPQCTPKSTYDSGYGYSDRVTIAGGSKVGEYVSSLEDVVIHKIMNGLSDTTLSTAELNPSSSWMGGEACGSTSCMAYLGTRGTATYTSVPSFVTSVSSTLPYQYLISGLSPGVYTATVGGRPVSGSPFTVSANDNSIEFESVAGTVSINQSVRIHAVLSSIAVSANSASLAYNNTEEFTATGVYSDTSTADLTDQVTWGSSAPGVATISAGGLATALATGQTSITATQSGIVSNRFQLTVVPGTPAAISVFSGSGQSAMVGTAFSGLLQALVKDGGGNAAPNASVTFAIPSNGAGGTFANGKATYTATTNNSGVATSVALIANITPGSYSVTAAVTGLATAASFSLTNLELRWCGDGARLSDLRAPPPPCIR
jgi:Bacterial Ig-like domain (group 2)